MPKAVQCWDISHAICCNSKTGDFPSTTLSLEGHHTTPYEVANPARVSGGCGGEEVSRRFLRRKVTKEEGQDPEPEGLRKEEGNLEVLKGDEEDSKGEDWWLWVKEEDEGGGREEPGWTHWSQACLVDVNYLLYYA